jgi:excisionase family DNA binding protein
MEKNQVNQAVFASYPDVVTVKDLQEMLHIGRNAAYMLLRTGDIETVRIGKRYIIPKKSVISFLEAVS